MQAKEADDRTTNRLSYEDQLYIWSLLLQANLVGKVKRRPRTEYILLVPDVQAVAQINALSDTPITIKHLPSIVRRFRHLEPPYSSSLRTVKPISANGCNANGTNKNGELGWMLWGSRKTVHTAH